MDQQSPGSGRPRTKSEPACPGSHFLNAYESQRANLDLDELLSDINSKVPPGAPLYNGDSVAAQSVGQFPNASYTNQFNNVQSLSSFGEHACYTDQISPSQNNQCDPMMFDYGNSGRYRSWSAMTDDESQFTVPPPDWSAFQRQASIPDDVAAEISNFASYDDYINLLSQTDSNPSSKSSQQNLLGSFGSLDGLDLDFTAAAQDGQSLYTAALNQWTSHAASGAYNPFGGNSPAENAPTQNGHIQNDPSNQDAAKESSSSKLSYSEVTRNKMQGLSSGSSRKKKNQNKETTQLPKNFQPRKFRPRPVFCARGHDVDDNIVHPVKPDSKYGLDDFSIPEEHKEESLPIGRKGSTGSATSSAGTMEDSSKQTLKGNKDKQKTTSTETGDQQDKRPFFDPRRIFASSKNTPISSDVLNNRVSSAKSSKGENIAMNNECNPSASTQTIQRPASTYINNDLRSTERKRSNANSNAYNPPSYDYEGELPDLADDISTASSSGSSLYQQGQGQKPNKHINPKKADKKGKKSKKSENRLLGDGEFVLWLLKMCYDWFILGLKYVLGVMVVVFLLIFRLAILLLTTVYSKCMTKCSWLWDYVMNKCCTRWKFSRNSSFYDSWNSSNTGTSRRLTGLEENIILPSTGEEAMKRLLSCKGKDPYSILGLRSDASDEDIKKYYKRQAILVHPDKNHHPGSEETFKILGHSFELIGDPTKRKLYDAQHAETQEAENCIKEFVELLNQLRKKMEEATNMMRCETCGGKHKRYSVDRMWYSARFCSRCQIMHSAKEGDVWAESRFMGFIWHYYALMDGSVYDITEWAAHQTDYFKHIQANAHHVFYRIGTNSTRQGKPTGNSNEDELNDFISHLFSHPRQQKTASTGDSFGSTNTSASKKGRKKRGKKH